MAFLKFKSRRHALVERSRGKRPNCGSIVQYSCFPPPGERVTTAHMQGKQTAMGGGGVATSVLSGSMIMLNCKSRNELHRMRCKGVEPARGFLEGIWEILFWLVTGIQWGQL